MWRRSSQLTFVPKVCLHPNSTHRNTNANDSTGTAFSMMGLYLADIIILVAGPIAFNNISWKFFFVLIVPTFFHIIFVYFMCPETKGRSLEDINVQFGEKVAIHFYGATAEEQAELEKAALKDEEDELQHKRTSISSLQGQVTERKASLSETRGAAPAYEIDEKVAPTSHAERL